MIILNIIGAFLLPFGICLLMNRTLAAEKFEEISKKYSHSGMYTKKKWNKKILLPIGIVSIVMGISHIIILTS